VTCRATIEKLRADNNKFKEELLLENKFSVTPIDNISGHRLVCMQDEADVMTRKVALAQAAFQFHADCLDTPGHVCSVIGEHSMYLARCYGIS
jgi:hypothetical protein